MADPKPIMPSRGAVAGARADAARQKQEGAAGIEGRNASQGSWSHNFLNQKPWHPLNFRNQIRKFEAETKFITDKKIKEQALAEFQAEQEKMLAMSFMSEADRQRYADKQSVSFMYAKPPGLEAALARDKAEEEKRVTEQQQQQLQQQEGGSGAAAAAAAAGPGPSSAAVAAAEQRQAAADQLRAEQAERNSALDKLREDPFTAMFAARAALQNNDRFELKHNGSAAAGRSPPRGGLDASAHNQQLLTDELAEEATGAAGPGAGDGGDDGADALLASLSEKDRKAVLKALEKKRRKQEEAAKLQQAQEVLRAAGIDPGLTLGGGSSKPSKKAHKKEHKHKGKHKKSDHHRRREGGGDGDSDSDGGEGGGAEARRRGEGGHTRQARERSRSRSAEREHRRQRSRSRSAEREHRRQRSRSAEREHRRQRSRSAEQRRGRR